MSCLYNCNKSKFGAILFSEKYRTQSECNLKRTEKLQCYMFHDVLCNLLYDIRTLFNNEIFFCYINSASSFLSPFRNIDEWDRVFWLICLDAPIRKIIFEIHIKMLNNSDKKSRVYIRTFYVRSQNMAVKRHFVCSMKRRQKNAKWKPILKHKKLSFLHRPKKLSFLREILCANIECPDVPEDILKKLNILKYDFYATGVSTPMTQSEYLKW
jgi:hypothetical protein